MRSRRAAVLLVAVAMWAGAVPAACAPEPRAVPDACPQRWSGEGIGGWVPAAVDVDGADESLVPGSPVRALICAYPGVNMDPGGERPALWVGSAEEVNSCVTTTNGTVRTRSYAGKALTAAYREGTWRG
ncbi:hypothetical protein [Microbispora sp. KK1-11]|uniref:hypothetical protein n=1 Tax=Microbispora sp. KK1-11 TaxID=2053005 RepID=UPI00115B51FD|nr:hypothetical protein [Microbispora sp. KK1-11]TQS22791.1 hypothetical protein FLW16_37670 [Microbispora sp. KK1-11]